MRNHVLSKCLILLLALSAGRADAETLPFPDGRYVIDPQYCSGSAYDFGEFGLFIRVLDGSEIQTGHESACQISNVSVFGSDVLFDATCSAEGEQNEIRMHLVKKSDTSFESNGDLFSLCDSREQRSQSSAPQVPSERVPGMVDDPTQKQPIPERPVLARHFHTTFSLPERTDLQWSLALLELYDGPIDGVINESLLIGLLEYSERFGSLQSVQMSAGDLDTLRRIQRDLRFPPGSESTFAAIRDTQDILTKLGFSPGLVDGQMGAATQAAVMEFQRLYQLPLTGRLDQLTLDRIYKANRIHSEILDAQGLGQPHALIVVPQAEPQSPLGAGLNESGVGRAEDKAFHGTSDFERVLQRSIELQARILAEPSEVFLHLRDGGAATGTPDGLNAASFGYFFEPTIRHAACLDETRQVFGFFNVQQNIWLLTLVDQENAILDAKLASNLTAQDASWWDQLAPDVTLMGSLRTSLEIQSDAFSNLFDRDCQTKFDRFAQGGDAPGKTLVENYTAMKSIDEDTLLQLNLATNQNQDNQSANKLILAMTQTDVFGADILTAHTLDIYPAATVVQLWDYQNGKLELVKGGYEVIE